jgi:hypothetical protein
MYNIKRKISSLILALSFGFMLPTAVNWAVEFIMNLELVGDDLVMCFSENGQPVDNYRSGRYIREK